MQKTLCLLMVALLAGCAGETPDLEADADSQAGPTGSDTGTADGGQPETIDIRGVVQDEAVVPIAGADITVRELNLTTTTGADGRFVFEDLERRFYVVEADAADFAPATLTLNPHDVRELLFVLDRVAEEPRFVTVPFNGIIQCAAEYLIITPSCDSAIEFLAQEGVPLPNGGSITEDETQFDMLLEANWRTVVVDVVFDLEGNAGLEALRTVVSGTNDPNAAGTYDQYGRFQSPSSYNFHLQPGQEYPEGDKPVPDNSTGLRLNVYGQGHGWHATCDAICLLGIGVGVDVSFELYATVFYVEPAPEGWSFVA